MTGAIYSVKHGSVGKSTQKRVGTSGAHAKYILRGAALGMVLGEHMPTGRYAAQAWLDRQEEAERKNGRVIDKVMIALPLALTAEQRAEAVKRFAQEIGGGRISWVAGIHDRGKDEANPHAHVILRDKDFETGKRVAGLSEKGSTDRIRETWERVANQALEQAGREERVDRRSLKDQGVDRQAGIHVGPAAFAMQEEGRVPESQQRVVHLVNGETRVIDYPAIDEGRTRADRQAEIEAANAKRMQPQIVDTPQASQVQAQAKRQEQAARVVAEALPEALPGASVEVETPIGAKPAAPEPEKSPERQRPAPRLFEQVFTAAAELTQRVIDRAAALFQRQQQKPEAAPIIVKNLPQIDNRTPRQKQADELKAMQERDRQQRERMSLAELQALLDRDRNQDHSHRPKH